MPEEARDAKMTATSGPDLAQALRRAAVRATLAHSVRNTQPWRFVLSASSLQIHADWTRRLRVLDPRGRQLLISCGSAVFNARVALAADGYEAILQPFPDPANPDLLAQLTVAEQSGEQVRIGALDSVVRVRRTNYHRFTDEPTPDIVVDALIRAARLEGGELVPITQPQHRSVMAQLNRQAADLEEADPAYRAELRAWTTPTPPYFGDGAGVDDGRLCQLLLGTRHDTPAAWLQAGQALEHVWLETTQRGYAASPLTQVTEVAATNGLLRRELQLTMHPHVLLYIGRAPPTPASRRRRLVEVLDIVH